MDILMLNPLFYPYMGGTEKHILEVGKRLTKKYNITVLTAQIERTKRTEVIDEIKVVRTPSYLLKKTPHPLPPPAPLMTKLVQDLKRLIPENDIVHIHNRFAYNAREGKIVKKAGKKLLLTLHNSRTSGIDPITDFFGGFYDDFFASDLMMLCDGIASVSKNTLSASLPEEYKRKTTVIYNGVDERIFRPLKKSSKWREYFEDNGLVRRIIFTNARLIQQKGIRYLIEAMQGVDADLVVFGRGPLKDTLELQARRLGINAHFISDRLDDRELAELYNAIDIFVLPSLYEPFGVALVEAMACGKPVIGTNVGGIPEVIRNRRNGLIVDAKSPDSTARAIVDCLENEKVCRSLGENARKTVLKRFTWDLVAKRMDRFYNDCI
ncbi:glycosyltransferase family 4 protein [Candidatus Micrarchaeota archaeon]|nr:glycosyltransferase family 4 protein [Candidatus Micrarchaeota archaeon]